MVKLVRIGDDMKEVPTESILSLIKDNSNLPFYVLAECVDLYYDECGHVLQEIKDIGIDEIWKDDERTYILSYDEEDLIDEYLEGIYNDIGEDEYNKHDDDYWERVAEDWIDSLDWERCIVAWAYNV